MTFPKTMLAVISSLMLLIGLYFAARGIALLFVHQAPNRLYMK